MDSQSLLSIIVLGVVEGITEFLPVSSTGHLILAAELLGYDPARWKVFNIVIQLGAILAIVVLYWRTLWAVALGFFRGDAASRRFVRNLLLAFFPAVVIGLLFNKQIDALLGSPAVVAVALIAGGLAILVIERLVKHPAVHGVAAIPAKSAVSIGFLQCLAMIPGVSRSGATIMGGLSLGVERRTAAEFSFFLAIPTMLGATTLELVKNRGALDSHALGEIALGFVISFIVAVIVVRAFIRVIGRYGFAPFAWYRIVAGSAALIWLLAK